MAKRPTKKGKDPDRKGAMGDYQGEFVLKSPEPESPPAPKIPTTDAESVARGARWLDVLRPGWERLIPIATLSDGTRSLRIDLQSVRGCPLSIACGTPERPDFAAGVRLLCRPEPHREKSSPSPSSASRRPRVNYTGADTGQLAAYGFAPTPHHPAADPYRTLNDLWRAEIERRLEGSLTKDVPCCSPSPS